MRPLIILSSYHHKNTEKIANVIAKVIDTQVNTPEDVVPEEILEYDLIGFGSGIYDGKNHSNLLELAERLPAADGRKTVIFSTVGAVMIER